MTYWVLRCATSGEWLASQDKRPAGAEFPVIMDDGRESYWAEEIKTRK